MMKRTVLLGQVELLAPLATGETQSVTILVEGDLPYRNAPIRLSIDPLGQVIESDKQNNSIDTASLCLAAGSPAADLSISLLASLEVVGGGVRMVARIGNGGPVDVTEEISGSDLRRRPNSRRRGGWCGFHRWIGCR